jgi:hypothetical protein
MSSESRNKKRKKRENFNNNKNNRNPPLTTALKRLKTKTLIMMALMI